MFKKISWYGIFLLIVMTAMTLFAVSALKLNWDKKITAKELGGENRYMSYVSTDKPLYRPGETVYFRVVILTKDNLPADSSKPKYLRSSHVKFEIKNSKDESVTNFKGKIENSTGAGSWIIPQGSGGGTYKVSVKVPALGCPESVREFDVLSYRVVRLKKDIEFEHKAYGPGDDVKAVLSVKRSEGGIPANAGVTATALLDGRAIFQKKDISLDKNGKCTVEFKLPEKIDKGNGTLNFVIKDGGTVENAAKTIPIALNDVKITFYPESGDLTAGVKNRVYFKAELLSLGKPADINGSLFELTNGKVSGNSLSDLKSVHEGEGIFSFIPEKGKSYGVILKKPAGIDKIYTLPAVKESGAVFEPLKKIFPFKEKISLNVRFLDDFKPGFIYLLKREQTLDSLDLSKIKSGDTVTLDPKDSEGVLIVTMTDNTGVPVAERLVFRDSRFKLNISLKTDKENYQPGDKVNLQIETTDKNGKPVEAVVGLSVVDDAVLKMKDKRLIPPRLPVMVFLEPEVMKLEDAGVYFDEKNKNAPEYIDLLLGIQGWRRFILLNYKEIKKLHKYDAMRALAEKNIEFNIMRKGKGMLKEELEDVDAVFMALPKDKKAAPCKINAPVMKEQVGNPLMMEDKFADKDEIQEKMQKRRRADKWTVIREYAHTSDKTRKAEERNDFTETVYWCAGIKTGARNGKASLQFDLSDSITVFKVMADAFARNGAVASADCYISSRKSFYIEPKMPLITTVGDKVKLPLTLVNLSEKTLDKVNLILKCDDAVDVSMNSKTLSLKPDERKRMYADLSLRKSGKFELYITASADGLTDTVKRTLSVLPKGFPAQLNAGGFVGDGKNGTAELVIPEKYIPGSLKTRAVIFVSPLANMEEALNALLREPHGCFEQTSSTNYPVVMVSQYLRTHSGVSADVVRKTDALLKEGYNKLVKYECSKKGYEWFGADPGHEALTAYGLMEFADMAKVMPVDKKMLKRTENWLLSRRDGNGGFNLNKKALDSFGRAPVKMTNAYIVWSLLESGKNPTELKSEIESVRKSALNSNDSYLTALAANIMLIAKDTKTGIELCQKLVAASDKNGALTGAESTITNSGGISKQLETTSLAIMAWLKTDGQFAVNVEKSINWIFKQCKSGSFGSTQSTILALKAINAYDSLRQKISVPGDLQLIVDGNPFGKPVHFGKNTKSAIELPDFSSALTPGRHKVEIAMKGGSKLPYGIDVSYRTILPLNSAESRLKLTTELSETEVNEGTAVTMNVTVVNGDEKSPTPLAVIGIPGGCEVRFDSLKELQSRGVIDFFELYNSKLVFYWRTLEPGQKVEIPVSLTAAVPGEYTAPASSVYPYYTNENKYWVSGTKIKIKE